jgi:two-component system, NarL family, nitrate/nitrite response regulator NarL
MGAIKVAVFDDHPLFREGVVNSLDRHDDIEVVAVGGSAGEAIAAALEISPDVIVLDMTMPGDGVAAVAAITAAAPTVRTVMLTVVSCEEQVWDAMQKGARGYLLKGVGGAELANTIRSVYHGNTHVAPNLTAHLLAHLARKSAAPLGAGKKGRLADLSAREEQILAHIAQGMSNKEIALRLSLSDKTVKHYTTSILQKLKVRNRVEAALIAVERFMPGSAAPGPSLIQA